MKRGELWTISGGADYAGKPRPALILQDDDFPDTESITLCPLTSNQTGGPDLRIFVSPTLANGLKEESRVMIDKVSTLSRQKVGKRVGVLTADQIAEVELSVMIFLGLAR